MLEGEQDGEGSTGGPSESTSSADDGVTRIKAATGFSCFNCRDQKRYCDKAYPCGRCVGDVHYYYNAPRCEPSCLD